VKNTRADIKRYVWLSCNHLQWKETINFSLTTLWTTGLLIKKLTLWTHDHLQQHSGLTIKKNLHSESLSNLLLHQLGLGAWFCTAGREEKGSAHLVAAASEGVRGLEEAAAARRALAASRRPQRSRRAGRAWCRVSAELRVLHGGLHRRRSRRIAASNSPPSPTSGCTCRALAAAAADWTSCGWQREQDEGLKRGRV
jgi:hypothetical protein